MKRLLALLLASALGAPAIAQHQGHHMPGHAMPAPKAKPAPKPKPKPAAQKAAPKKLPARSTPKTATKTAVKRAPVKKMAPKPVRKPAAKPAPKRAVPAKDPHAGHQMPATPPAETAPAADPHAGHHMPAPKPTAPAADPHAGHTGPTAPDPHAGHDMGAPPAQADPHAGHQMSPSPSPPVAPPPPGAFSGPAHAADAVFDTQQMAAAREGMRREHGEMTTHSFLVDRLEARIRDGRDGYEWDAQGWIGGDIDKFWAKSEGEGEFGGAVEHAEIQGLWSHAIDPWFDLQAGIRHDFRPRPQRTHFVLGVQGLAPYWFEVDAAAFLSTKGDVTARLEAEYDQRITQKLILQPRIEFDLAAQDVPELGIGSGLSTAEAGLRLRYEIVPEFAPYVGIEYERAFGDTADFRRAAGEKVGGWSFLLGLRAWF